MEQPIAPQVPAAFQWIVGILLSVIAFFLVSTFVKVDRVASNVESLMIKDGINQEWRKNIERDVDQMKKNRASLSQDRATTIN